MQPKAVFLFMVFLFISSKGNASDSTYIIFHWNGEQDKPHYNFVFHRRGVAFSPENGVFGNLSNLFVELTDSSFTQLANAVFNIERQDCPNVQNYRLQNAYFIAYFKGEESVNSWMPCTEVDYKSIYRIFIELLRGTKYESDFKWRWKMESLPVGLRTTAAVALWPVV